MTDLRSVVGVVRQDALDARRARLVQGVLGLYVLFVGVVFAGVGLTPNQPVYTAIQITAFVGFLFVPLVSLLAGYLAVAGERESGTIRLLLGYPVTRSEVVLGKYVSRLSLIAVAVVLGFLVGGAVATGLFADPRLAAVATFGGLTLLFAAAYLGIGIAVSATSASRGRAMTKTVAAYFVFTLLWSRVAPVTVPQVVTGTADLLLNIELSGPLWEVFVALSPTEAYYQSLQLLPESGLGVDSPVGGAAALVVLLGWVVVPPALGYLSFARADID